MVEDGEKQIKKHNDQRSLFPIENQLKVAFGCAANDEIHFSVLRKNRTITNNVAHAPVSYLSQGGSTTPSLLTLICLYGYSLAIYIPVSILWLIRITLVQWLLVFAAACLTATVMIIVLSPALRNTQKSTILMAVISGAHLLLATGFMVYFFHGPAHAPLTVAPTVAPAVVGNHTS